MKTRKTPLTVAAVVAVGMLAAACGSSSSRASSPTSSTTPAATASAATASKNIVQIAESNPDFSTLVSAVKAAGLVSTLEGSGPFTVFAPTNAAFAALPSGTLPTLLEPANRAMLAKILTYHVVSGALKADQIMPGAIKTVNGATFTVNSAGGKLTITDGKGHTAQIVQTNIVAANGVIHVINAVLLPPSQ